MMTYKRILAAYSTYTFSSCPLLYLLICFGRVHFCKFNNYRILVTMDQNSKLNEVETTEPSLKVFPGITGKNYVAAYKGYLYTPHKNGENTRILR